jgi:hypothetical protein
MGLLPISAGQLSSFRCRGTAADDPYQAPLLAVRLGVDDMLAADVVSAPAAETALDRECRVFAAHLLGYAPDPYVRGKYTEAHRVVPGLGAGDRFDRFLLRFARAHRVSASIADAYARIFAPASTLRQKLVVLLAILETSAPAFRLVDAPPGGPRGWVLVHLGIRASGALLSLALGTLLLGPARVLLSERRQ